MPPLPNSRPTGCRNVSCAPGWLRRSNDDNWRLMSFNVVSSQCNDSRYGAVRSIGRMRSVVGAPGVDDDEDDDEDDGELPLGSASSSCHVCSPTMPSAPRPCSCWKRSTDASVMGPKSPSTALSAM